MSVAVGLGVVKAAPAAQRQARGQSAHGLLGVEADLAALEAVPAVHEHAVGGVDADVGHPATDEQRLQGPGAGGVVAKLAHRRQHVHVTDNDGLFANQRRKPGGVDLPGLVGHAALHA